MFVLELGHLVARAAQPLVPSDGIRSDIGTPCPLGLLRDGDSLPEGLGEVHEAVAAGVALLVDAVERDVPMQARRQGGDDPVGGVEDDVGAAPGDLEFDLGVGERDDAEHEQHGAGEGDETVRLQAHHVVAFLRRPVQLARDVLVAFDHVEGAVRVADHNVAGGHLAFGRALRQLERPFRPDADDGGEGGEQDVSHEGHAVAVVDAQAQEHETHRASQQTQPRERPCVSRLDRFPLCILGEADAAHGVVWQAVATVEDVGHMVQFGLLAAGFATHYLAVAGCEPVRARGLDESLWGGEEAREEDEFGEGGDLRVCEHSAFT